MKQSITPTFVLGMKEACNTFLCPIEANVYDISYGKSLMKNLANNQIISEFSPPGGFMPLPSTDKQRFLQFSITSDFLKYHSISVGFEYKIGPKELKNFRYIERSYCKNKLVKCYDVEFGECPPNSIKYKEIQLNSQLFSEQEISEIVKHSEKCKIDGFYFNENNLFLHLRSEITFK